MFLKISGYIIFSGTILSLLLSFKFSILHYKKNSSILPAIIYFLLSGIIFEFVLLNGILIDYYRFPYYFRNTFLCITGTFKFCIGPLYYIYIKSITNYKFNPSIYQKIHFIPAIINLFATIFIIYFPPILPSSIISFMHWLWKFLIILSIIHITIYFLFVILYLITQKSYSVSKYEYTPSLLFQVFTVLLICSSFIVFAIINSKPLNYFSHTMIVIFIIVIYILTELFPEMFTNYIKVVKDLNYRKSKPYRLYTKFLKEKLKKLMETEKLFCDEDLTLSRLAAHLSISSHELSKFLNTEYKNNFSSFINKYRVEEAKNLLLEDMNRSILLIAHNSGFNTKSAFNNAFKKFTGITPSKYREINNIQ